jgi:hypothetical protein
MDAKDPDKAWAGFAHPAHESAMIKMCCFVCGSENLSTEKCKVWCRYCHALIENCSCD